MPTAAPISKSDLGKRIGAPIGKNEFNKQLVENIYSPRMIRSAAAEITLTDDAQGALIISERATGVTVPLPAGLPTGFIVTFLQLGTGALTFTGTHLGGSTSGGQNTMCSAMVLDDGTWLVYGSVS